MRETTEIEPIVPQLPAAARPLTDGGRSSTRLRRPPETDCTPEDEGRESIEPLVPDIR